MVINKAVYVGLIMFSLIFTGAVFAAETRRDDAGGAAKAQFLMRQIATERDAALAKNAELQLELDKLKASVEKKEKRQKTRMKRLKT